MNRKELFNRSFVLFITWNSEGSFLECGATFIPRGKLFSREDLSEYVEGLSNFNFFPNLFYYFDV